MSAIAAVRLMRGDYVLPRVRLIPFLFLLLALPARAADAPVVVAVVDSGVNASVPGQVAGYNAADGSTDATEPGGHGTGVAQVVAATCGGCRIMPVRIADETGSSTQATIAA